jgi:putative copper export protein
MSLYQICVALHLIAMSLWLGHMLVWSLVAGPSLKKIVPIEVATTLRRLSMTMGGLGWPALVVLWITGYVQLQYRGITWELLISGQAFTVPGGWVLAAKLALVVWMVGFQAVFAHKPAPRAIYLNMAAALAIIGLSVLLVRPVI